MNSTPAAVRIWSWEFTMRLLICVLCLLAML